MSHIRSKSWLTRALVAVFISGAIVLVWRHEQSLTTMALTSSVPSTAHLTFDLIQVAEHGNADSCWTIIEERIYDLTKFIDQHPGGAKSILAICGSNGTDSFNSMPAAVLPIARLTLPKYYLGDLVTQ